MVYTNGTAPYAQNVLNARGLQGCFDAIYGVEHAGYRPKPEAEAFERVFDLAGVTAASAAMFEDEIRNLEVPHTMGLRTIWIAQAPAQEAYVDITSPRLQDVLSHLHMNGFSARESFIS